PLPKEPTNKELQGALRTCSILSKAISNTIFTSVINNKNKQNPFTFWTDIKTIYASDLLLSMFQVWNKWLDIQYNKDLNLYIIKMEESLTKFSSLGLKVPDVLVGCGIVGKITKRRPMLMQALFANLKALAKPKEIIAKLRDMAATRLPINAGLSRSLNPPQPFSLRGLAASPKDIAALTLAHHWRQ
ncbi:hypothetical protein PTTG_05977, partial [Puccinia triticina 1-1 BBBD Race 1]